MANAYTTKTRVKTYLKIPDANVDDDTTLDEIIAGVSDAFDSYARRTFVQVQATEYYDGLPQALGIVLDRTPSEDATDRIAIVVTESDVVLVKDTDYWLGAWPTRTLFRLDGAGNQGNFHFLTGVRNVQVDYLNDFKVTPADIELAATEESTRHFKNLNTTDGSGEDRIGVSSNSPETGTSRSFEANDFLPNTRRVLERYWPEV